MNLNTKIALGVLTSLLVFGGCQQQRQAQPPHDPLEAHYRLLDRGEYNRAIYELQKLSREDARPTVKVALASAYAARAGIRVSDYWGFLIGFEAPLMHSEAEPANATLAGLQKISKQVDAQDLKALGGLVHSMVVWEQYKDRVEAIPVVSGASSLEDMQRAIETLQSVSTPGGRLYRAVLNLILFKSYVSLSQGLWDRFSEALQDLVGGRIEVLCSFDFEEIPTWLNPITFHLMEALEDLMVAYPEDRQDLEDAYDLIKGVRQLTNEAVKELHQKRTCKL